MIHLLIKIRGHSEKLIFIEEGPYMREIYICFCNNLALLKEKICLNSNSEEFNLNGKKLHDNKKDLAQLGIKKLSILSLYDYIDKCDYKEKFKKELIQLKDMGFSNEENNIQILRVSAGNIRYVIEHYYQYLKNTIKCDCIIC